jgi:iron complex transport system substrate-binding protein
MRIVSLLPSATEIVFALGLGDQLVGVTFECDHPLEARSGRSVVVGGLDTHGLDPGEIDALVRAELAAGRELYHLDRDRFAACAPDVVLTQDLCRVCALPSGTVDEAARELGCDADVVTLDPHTLVEVLDSIVTVAEHCGVAERGHELVAALDQRLAAVGAAVAGPAARHRPRVLVVEWVDPPFLAGHWVPELVTRAGGTPVLAAPGARSTATSWDEVRAAVEQGVDLVLVAPCGYDVDGAVVQAAEVRRRLGADLPVWAIDANGIVVRPGPRLVEGVETVAAILHGIGTVDPSRARLVSDDMN